MQGYRDIGQLLASAREERHYTVNEVAQALHIRARYVEALEAGRLEGLPGLPYAKGYLKRYAVFVGLDKVEILRRFELVAQEAQLPSFFMPHHFSLEKHIPVSFGLLSAAASLLLLLVWALLRPERPELPLVEPLPKRVMETPKAAISAKTMERVACLRPEVPVYPPCYWPVPENEPSVMTIIKP